MSSVERERFVVEHLSEHVRSIVLGGYETRVLSSDMPHCLPSCGFGLPDGNAMISAGLAEFAGLVDVEVTRPVTSATIWCALPLWPDSGPAHGN